MAAFAVKDRGQAAIDAVAFGDGAAGGASVFPVFDILHVDDWDVDFDLSHGRLSFSGSGGSYSWSSWSSLGI